MDPHTLVALKEFGVPKRYRSKRIADMKEDRWCESIAAFLSDPRRREWREPGWIVASGGQGRGKTAWLTAVFNEVVEDRLKEKPDIWVSEGMGPKRPVWIDELTMQMKMNQSAERRSQITHAMAKCPVLMIDDIGGGAISEARRTALRFIVNERYNAERRTLITTTLTPDELFSYMGAAAASRISEVGDVFRLRGPDRRSAGKGGPDGS